MTSNTALPVCYITSGLNYFRGYYISGQKHISGSIEDINKPLRTFLYFYDNKIEVLEEEKLQRQEPRASSSTSLPVSFMIVSRFLIRMLHIAPKITHNTIDLFMVSDAVLAGGQIALKLKLNIRGPM